MQLPINNHSGTFGQVMFLALTQLKGDHVRFHSLYLRSVGMIGLVAFPMMAGLAILARLTILLFYGTRWVEGVPIFTILSIVGMVQAIGVTVGWVFTALGATRAQFHVSIVLAAAFALAIWVVLLYGLIGITCTDGLWTLLSLTLNMAAVARVSRITLFDVARQLGRIAAATALMAAVVAVLDRAIDGLVPAVANLAVGVAAGVATFALACRLLCEPTFYECVAMVPNWFRRRPAMAFAKEEVLR